MSSFLMLKSRPRIVRLLAPAGHAQPKLELGAPNDRFEQEADRVADQVLRMPAATVQRKCATCEKESEEKIQRSCSKCEKEDETKARRKTAPAASGASSTTVSAETADGISSLRRGGGRPLPVDTRAFFEPRFGQDFSGVRIHTGEKAGGLARSIQARAFTLGNDVAFAPGQFQPGTPGGRHLLAHELTHTLQQTGGTRAANVARREPASRTASPSPKRPEIVRVITRSGVQPFVSEGFLGDLIEAVAVQANPQQGDPDIAVPPVEWQVFLDGQATDKVTVTGRTFEESSATVQPCTGLETGQCNAIELFLGDEVLGFVGKEIKVSAGRPGAHASALSKAIKIRETLTSRSGEAQVASRLFQLLERCILFGNLIPKKQDEVIHLLSGLTASQLAAVEMSFAALTRHAVTGRLRTGTQRRFNCIREESLTQAVTRRLTRKRREQALAAMTAAASNTSPAPLTGKSGLLEEIEAAGLDDDAASLQEILGTQFTGVSGISDCSGKNQRRKLLFSAGNAVLVAEAAIKKVSQDSGPADGDFHDRDLSPAFHNNFFPDGLENYPAQEIARTKTRIVQVLSDARNGLLKASSFTCAGSQHQVCKARATNMNQGLGSTREVAESEPLRGSTVVVCPTFFGKNSNVRDVAVLHELVHQAGIAAASDEIYRDESGWAYLKHAKALRMADAYAMFAWEAVRGKLRKI